jgi:hypothetical protein
MKTKTHRQKLKEKVIENKFQFYKLIKKINWKNKNQIWMKKNIEGLLSNFKRPCMKIEDKRENKRKGQMMSNQKELRYTRHLGR